MQNILFICSANKDRSKTAEDYFSVNYPSINFDSAGTNWKTCNQLGTNFITQDQLEWADKVYVMENKHLKKLNEIFGNSYFNKIEKLNIKDIYKYNQKELIELLKDKLDFSNR